jgi:aldose 1-epimerase
MMACRRHGTLAYSYQIEWESTMKTTIGQTPTGHTIDQITLDNGILNVKILSLGGIIQSISWCDDNRSMVLGYPTSEPYLTNPGKLGALVGRYANRIGGATAEINGVVCHFDPNSKNKHTLHGGRETLGIHVFDVVETTPISVHLRAMMPDGHMGFPGNLTIDAVYALDGSTLRMTLLGETDAATLCNITGHSYFNLSGSRVIDDHTITVHADQILATDDDQIPTGDYFNVANTDFDLRNAAALGLGGQVRDIDHNYCVSHAQTDLRVVAVLRAATNTMTLATTEAGLQVYTGKGLGAPLPSAPMGTAFHPFAGVALEPQFYPDSPNKPQFAQAVLRPNETYQHITEYRFARG